MKKNYNRPAMQVFNIKPCNMIAASNITLSQMSIPSYEDGGVLQTAEVKEDE